MSEEEDNDQSFIPGSPNSQASYLSRTSSFYRYERRCTRIWKYFFSWIVWPLNLLISIPWLIYHYTLGFRTSRISNRRQYADLHVKGINSVKHNVVHRATDRRRGVIEVFPFNFLIIFKSCFFLSLKFYLILISRTFKWRLRYLLNLFLIFFIRQHILCFPLAKLSKWLLHGFLLDEVEMNLSLFQPLTWVKLSQHQQNDGQHFTNL